MRLRSCARCQMFWAAVHAWWRACRAAATARGAAVTVIAAAGDLLNSWEIRQSPFGARNLAWAPPRGHRPCRNECRPTALPSCGALSAISAKPLPQITRGNFFFSSSFYARSLEAFRARKAHNRQRGKNNCQWPPSACRGPSRRSRQQAEGSPSGGKRRSPQFAACGLDGHPLALGWPPLAPRANTGEFSSHRASAASQHSRALTCWRRRPVGLSAWLSDPSASPPPRFKFDEALLYSCAAAPTMQFRHPPASATLLLKSHGGGRRAPQT